MTTYTEQAREIRVRGEYDVLVVGGGTAGAVAAIAAARSGAKTMLVERYGILGGTIVLGGVCTLHSFFNVYKPYGVERKQLVKGIPIEIVNRMIEAGGCLGHIEQERGFGYDSMITPIDHEVFKSVIMKMAAETGMDLLLHTLMVDTITQGGSVKGIIVESKSGREAILAKIIVDCTGDADVSHRAGALFVKDLEPNFVGGTFSMANVDIPKATAFFDAEGVLDQLARCDRKSENDHVARFSGGVLSIERFREQVEKIGMKRAFMTYSLHEHDLTYINSIDLPHLGELSVDNITEREKEMRCQLDEIVAFARENIPGFEKAYVSWTSHQVGIRRSRIVDCEYDITIEDIEGGRRFDDEIGIYGFHDRGPKFSVNKGGAYGIPYRAIVPKKLENLLVAGRLISSSWAAHMSTRNSVSCMLQGQAAGTAAALCARDGVTPRKLDAGLLHEALVRGGVYFGQD